jgi:adenylate cyclase
MPRRVGSGSRWRWLALLPLPLVWCVLSEEGHLRFLENKLLDLRFRIRGEVGAPVNLVYVDVDTPAIELIGERPFNRAIYANVAEALLTAGGARVVAFDFVLSRISTSGLVDQNRARAGNSELRKVILAHPSKVVLAAQYTTGGAVVIDGEQAREIPLLRKGRGDRARNDVPEMPEQGFIVGPGAKPVGRVGLIDVDVGYSGDEVPRWVPLFAHTRFQTIHHFSLQVVLEQLGLGEEAVRITPEAAEAVRPDGSVALRVPLAEGQLLEANWFSRWESPFNPRESLGRVIQAIHASSSREEEQRRLAAAFFARFKDAIVLIGPVDPLLQDLAPTPFDQHPVPKVGLHGNLVKTMLTGKYLRRPAPWLLWLVVPGLTAVVCLLAVSGGTKGRRAKIAALAALSGYAGACVLAFNQLHLVLPMAAPLGSAFTTSFVAVMWQLLAEERQKGRIKGMFGAYVSPQLVERMVESGEDPRLGGHDAEITAYFSDIQSFSSFSEKLGSGPLVELMNEYLTACTDIVQAQGGTLDKYIGDAVVAMYGAPIPLPDHAYRACVATQLVHAKLAELRAKWRAEGDRWPEIVWNMQSRIGLNTGVCMIGNMGSRSRFNYTMMGDNVNLAARMESGAKSWGASTMVTGATRDACVLHGGDRVVFRALGRIVVMGRSQPVPIFEVVGLKESLPGSALECISLFEQGLARHLERDWNAAARLFRASSALEPNQPGVTPGVRKNPSLVYLEMVEECRSSPPAADWSGVHVMTEK